MLRGVARYCKDSRNALVASLIDLRASDQPQLPLSLEDRHILSQKTSVPGTSGQAHIGPLQATATIAISYSTSQPKPGVSQRHSTSGVNRVQRRGDETICCCVNLGLHKMCNFIGGLLIFQITSFGENYNQEPRTQVFYFDTQIQHFFTSVRVFI